MKKIIAIATSLAIIGMASPALGVTVQELQDQIAILLASIATLQAQITALGGGTPSAACTGITFTRNLTVGSSGTDVKCLQALLNTSADTQVAATGVGSSGSETLYFGPLTKAAVAKYQVKNGISPTAGYFGPLTRASIAPLLAGGVLPTPTPGVPAGCTGAEGSYTVTLSASPVSRTVNGGAGIEAYGLDIKAINSDVSIGSIDLQTGVTVGVPAITWGPGTFITGIKVYKDSVSAANLVKTYTNPVFTLDTANRYYTSLTGLGFTVLKDATAKVLIVLDTVESSDNNRIVTLNVYGNGIRGRDCLGIDRYLAMATTRVLTIQPASGNATLVLSLASDNPAADNIASNLTTGVSTDTPVLKFNAKAQSGSTTLIRLEVAYASYASAAATAASTANPSILKLYEGSTLIQSCTPGGVENGICTFENFRYPIAAEETKALTVMANWPAMVESTSNLFQANVPATSAHSMFERSNGSQVNTTVSSLMQGNLFYVLEQGVKFSFVSGTATAVPGGTTQVGSVTAVLKFKAQSFGQTLPQLLYASDATGSADLVFAELVWATGSDVRASGPALPINRVIQQTPQLDISDGVSADVTVTITGSFSGASGDELSLIGGGNVRGRIYAINWSDMHAGALLGRQICQGTLAICGLPGDGATPDDSVRVTQTFVDANSLTNNWVTNWSMLTAGLTPP